ncbi:hypothetical protein K466DRAFT_576438 [Polyporus arcularius HHB13444]|uniref:Uncharacterized protein n=1 Tax=Polyporus arcularius HHB13444 TaxID=1314778 RepID=A0A5C3PK37_9APHY|nr:hypothetical protein K466DRAFT_576438 [Polyporus arcularius HHB13444]
MLALTADIVPEARQLSGWVNEVFGILPIPDDVRVKSGMQIYTAGLDSKQRHAFLALKQGARKAVLPVHTAAEYQLFRKLVQDDPAFNQQTGEPDWDHAVITWNREAERNDEVYYKLIEHLKLYFSTWQTNMNIKHTLGQTSSTRKQTDLAVRDPKRSEAAPAALERSKPSQAAHAGILQPEDVEVPHDCRRNEQFGILGDGDSELTVSIAAGLLPDLASIAVSPGEASSAAPTPGPSATSRASDQLMAVARKRALTDVYAPPSKKPRQPRTCAKCGDSRNCPGRSAARLCPKPCQDCGQRACRGRNSKRPHRSCMDGWD